jgi:phosphocarrier protein HPr
MFEWGVQLMQHEVVIDHLLGLHARPACRLVELTRTFPCSIYLEIAGKRFSAKSVVNILLAGVKYGDTVTVISEGEREEEAIEAITVFLASKID